MKSDDCLANSVSFSSIASCSVTASPREYDIARVKKSLAPNEVQWWVYSIGGPLIGVEHLFYMITPTTVVCFSINGIEIVPPEELEKLYVDRKINVCVDVKEVPLFPDAKYRTAVDPSKAYHDEQL